MSLSTIDGYNQAEHGFRHEVEMTPAQRRLAQQMQQMQQDQAYERMRTEQLAKRAPAVASRTTAQAPRMSPAQQMMGVIRRADGGPVETTTTTTSPNAAAAAVVPPQGGLPTLEELMSSDYQLPGTMPGTTRAPGGYQWTTDAYGGMDQRTYDWMAPYVQAGNIIQPVRGAPAQVTVPTTYIPGIDFPATGTAGAGGGSSVTTPPSGGVNVIPGGVGMQLPVQPKPLQPPQAQIDPRITGLYESLLGRQPDTEGAMYWTNLLNQGVPLAEIQQGILRSEEGQVAALYQQILGRQPEAAGSQYWREQLQRGASAADVAMGIAASEEAAQRAAASSTPIYADTGINAIYQQALGRQATDPGAAYWQGKSASGTSMEDIAQGIRSSTEGQIAATYQQALGRAPDAAGMAYWIDAVNRGASVEDVQNAIRASEEARARA